MRTPQCRGYLQWCAECSGLLAAYHTRPPETFECSLLHDSIPFHSIPCHSTFFHRHTASCVCGSCSVVQQARKHKFTGPVSGCCCFCLLTKEQARRKHDHVTTERGMSSACGYTITFYTCKALTLQVQAHTAQQTLTNSHPQSKTSKQCQWYPGGRRLAHGCHVNPHHADD